MPPDVTSTAGGLSPLIAELRCLRCRGRLVVSELASACGYPGLGPDGSGFAASTVLRTTPSSAARRECSEFNRAFSATR